MKKIYSLITALLITSLGFGQIISQYVESESGASPKGIEIWNNTAGTLNFATNNLVIQTGQNGAIPSDVYTLATGTLTPGAVLIIGTTGSLQTIANNNSVQFLVFAFQFNGSDAIVVRYGATVTDRFGTPGSNPGTAWTGGGVSTANQNIALNTGITTGQAAPGFTNPSLRFSTVSTTPSVGTAGVAGFGIAPINACTPPTTQATAYNTTGITTSTATVNWTNSGSGNNVLVVVRKDNPVNADPTNGTNYVANATFGIGDQVGTLNYAVYKGTGSSATITGLTQNSIYHVAIYEYATAGTCFNTTELTGNFTTLCTSISTLPFSENFEGGAVPPSCWTTFRGVNGLGTAQDWKISASGDGFPNTGFAAQVDAEDVTPGISQDWLVTPGIELNVTENNQLTFLAKDIFPADLGSTYSVRLSTTSQTDIASFVTLATYNETQIGNTFTPQTVDLSAYDGETSVYIAFVMEQTDGFGDSFLLDNVDIKGDCIAPTTQASNFSATNINEDAGTATLNWTRGNGNNVLVVVRAGSAVDTDPESGIAYNSSPNFTSGDEIGIGNYVVFNGSGTTANVSGLIASETYFVAIYEYNNTAICYNTDELAGNFLVECSTFNLPFTEGFETSLEIPDCWAVFDNGVDTGVSWEVNSDSPNTGSNSAFLDAGSGFSGIAQDWLVTPGIDLTSVLFSELTFFSKDNDPFPTGVTYSIRVSTTSQTDPLTFTTIATYTEEQLGDDYNQKTINLTPYFGNIIYVAFVMEQDLSNGVNGWFLDDISIKAPVLPVRSFWFEPFTNNVQYDVTAGAEASTGDSNYFFITSGSNIDKIYAGNTGNFFAAQDVDDVVPGGASPSQLTWSNINISRYSQLAFSGEFASTALNSIDSDDSVKLEYRVDGGAWTNLIAFENDGNATDSFFLEDTDFDGTGNGTPLEATFQVFSKNIPSLGQSLDLRLTVALDGDGEDIAFENFRLDGIGTGFEGNDAIGFGGAIGESTLEVLAFQAPTIEFKLTKGSGDFNDYLVIYIDSKSGGIANTNNLTDTGDPGRKAISGLNNSDRASLVFPPGFRPDYAISLNSGFAGLYEILENDDHFFIQSANLNPSSTPTNSAAVYSFNIEFDNIETTPSQQGFKFLATYINGGNAFRSNESYGRNTAGVTNPGNPSTLTMETYYQVTSGLQGGIAPTIATGAWSMDSVWLNENPPLPEDEITINQNVALNIDATVLNGVTLNADLDILDTYSLTTNGGITGPGALDVSGTFAISQGGFTNTIPTYTDGSTLAYRNITGVYNRFNEWNEGTVVGAGVPESVIIDNANLDLSALTGNTVDLNLNVVLDLSLFNDASLNVDPTKSLTVGGTINNSNGTVNMKSTSTRYSSLIADSASGAGNFIYDRFTNGRIGVGVGEGGNDLISAPFTGQTFASFGTDPENANLLQNPNQTTQKAFGPFDKLTGTYLTWDTIEEAAEILEPAEGYRAATTDNGGLEFTGTLNTGNVEIGIVNAGPQFAPYNLIGNPYPSYLNVIDFLSYEVDSASDPVVRNIDLFVDMGAIYGYDGSGNGTSDTYVVYNLLTDPSVNMAPGQGFLVPASADPTLSGYNITFTPAMRSIDVIDDFIPGRQMNDNVFIKLQATIGTKSSKTSIYFNDMSSSGLDNGYDAAVFGSNAQTESIYSQLVQNNTGVDLAIQSLAYTDLGSDINVPIGINGIQGQQVTVSISESTLPEGLTVYLEDRLTNTFTMLNTTDYIFTPSANMTDTGRFFLRFNNSILSTSSTDLEYLQIYALNKSLVINGVLNAATTIDLYDVQGRIVLKANLKSGTTNNTVDVSSVSTGVYIVKLSNGLLEKTQRVIIK